VTQVLLEASADVNEVCCCCTSSGPYSFWTALDIARAGAARLRKMERIERGEKGLTLERFGS
jgi:hypothetical protein